MNGVDDGRLNARSPYARRRDRHHGDLRDVEQVLAATPDDAYNALVCTRFAPELGRERVHQLAMDRTGARHQASREWRGKIVVGENMTFQRLADLMQAGASLVVEPWKADGDMATIVDDGWPVAIVRRSGEFTFSGPEHAARVEDGDLLVRLYKAALAPSSKPKPARWRSLLQRRRLAG